MAVIGFCSFLLYIKANRHYFNTMEKNVEQREEPKLSRVSQMACFYSEFM